jgi:hypothetical protein
LLSTIRHEALYAAYILTQWGCIEFNENTTPLFEIKKLEELTETIELYNNNLNNPVKFKNKFYPYGLCLFNKWMGFNKTIKFLSTATKNETQTISKLILENVDNNIELYNNKLSELERKLFFFISSTMHCPTLNINEMVEIVDEKTQSLIDKIPSTNAYIGFHINAGLIDRCLKNFPHDKQLYKLLKSGSRFSKTQLSRSCINIGFIADDKNIVDQQPICSHLLSGLTEEEFFRSSSGTRKGIFDKSKITPMSGYLERTMVMALSPVEMMDEDCGCETGLEIIVQSKKHAESLIGKWFKCPSNNINEWTLFSDYKIVKQYINRKIILRSPMTCHIPNFKICKKCFGEKQVKTKYIGIVSAQCAIERLTQLVMRVL